ncbi:hypothetical protein MalM25_19650 [Planctomycetes bacterium MalM25]|nr:hypothetical protein MalM25_19650 [Planctomycetes bacterium MalM25]
MNQAMQRIGLTPSKGALIVLLAVGMGWVWAPLIFGEPKPQRRETIARTTDSSPTPTKRDRRGKTTPEVTPTPPVARTPVTMSLSEATRHDPFALPKWAPKLERGAVAGEPASPNQLRQRFESLASTGVAMLLVSEEGQAAQIGDRTVQVGDVLDGFRVVEISAAGVKFVPDEGEGDHGA